MLMLLPEQRQEGCMASKSAAYLLRETTRQSRVSLELEKVQEERDGRMVGDVRLRIPELVI